MDMCFSFYQITVLITRAMKQVLKTSWLIPFTLLLKKEMFSYLILLAFPYWCQKKIFSISTKYLSGILIGIALNLHGELYWIILILSGRLILAWITSTHTYKNESSTYSLTWSLSTRIYTFDCYWNWHKTTERLSSVYFSERISILKNS